MEFDLKIVVLSTVNFLILMVFLKKYFFDKLSTYLQNRRADIKNDFDTIDKEKRNIEIRDNEIKIREKQSHIEGVAIIEKYREKAELEKKRMHEELRLEIQSRRESEEAERVQKQKEYFNNIKETTKVVSKEICEKILSESLDQETQSKIIDSFIERLDECDV